MSELSDVETKPKMAKVVDLNVDIDTAEIDRKYRMYCLVLRQLSPIQKGVQSAHSIVEYGNKYGEEDSYIVWSRADKTIIMLDGGTLPELEEIIEDLKENKVKYSVFREEDLGDIVTSISILADERVFDRKNYPDFDSWRNNKYPVRPMHCVAYIGNFDHDPNDYTYGEHHDEWLNEVIGGKQNEFLRELLGSKRLSQ